MCGLAGIVRFDGGSVSSQQVQTMIDTIVHRGPDDEGVYCAGPVGLGVRRLAIIDLSLAGRQPMSNEDGTIRVTFNGEIYNFAELRDELERGGHVFRSSSDTEAIVHAYEAWGIECLARLNGMFAIAIWDGPRKLLWLVRDRIGIKPLFYCALRDRLLFGSEIKAILADPGVPREVDHQALSYFLALNYTPAPATLLRAVRQLLPGHYLKVDAARGRIQDVEYWDLEFDEGGPTDTRSAEERFEELAADSVRRRLVSDVPFGAFLSGGLDSSAISYWMSRHLDEPLRTFSIRFEESSYDEGPHAAEVARRIGSVHRDRVLTSAEAASLFPQLVHWAEEPTADASMVAVYYLAELARRHVTMVLSGDGADETLAGYETYIATYLYRAFRRVPGFLRRGLIRPLVRALPESDRKVSLVEKLKRFVAAEGTPEEAHASWRTIFGDRQRQRLLAPLAAERDGLAEVADLHRDLFAKTNARHPLNRMLYVDLRFYLPNDMLVKVDRMTMAHGLEARVPYLDHRLVELAAALPPGMKLRHFHRRKHVLRKVMAGRIPRRVTHRSKAGFNVPNALWLKTAMKEYVTDQLAPGRIRETGLLDEREVQRIVDDHFRGRGNRSHQIWCLLTLVAWWERFIAARPGS